MQAEVVTPRKWNPARVLTYLGASDGPKYACLLLNRPLDGRQAQFLHLWNGASYRVAVDGGANVLRVLMQSRAEDSLQHAKLPDIVTGDFDSITEETRTFFSRCEFVCTPDQDETDFTKALRQLASRAVGELAWVAAVADTSGRLDQTMANINTMFKADSLLGVPVFQVALDSLSWLLRPGEHEIATPAEVRRSWCSLVPVGERAERVSTTGLQWNLAGGSMSFGSLVSTSNRLIADSVTVRTSHPLLFSMEIP